MASESHRLHSAWTFYAFSQAFDKQKNYEKMIKPIARVETVEEFWATFTRIQRPRANNAIHFFRDNTRAMWEDEGNRNGGAFQLTFEQSQHGYVAWEKMLLGLIGERINIDVIGAVLSLKRDVVRIVIWNRTSNDLALKSEEARQLFEVAEMPFKSVIQYREHQADGKKNPETWILEASGAAVLKT